MTSIDNSHMGQVDAGRTPSRWKKNALKIGIPVGVLALALLLYGLIWAEVEKPILQEELPVASRNFIESHYPGSKLALARMERDWFEKEYEVVLTDGVRIKFDRKGEWKQVKDKMTGVPPAVVPEAIMQYLQQTYPQEVIREISRDRHEIEVELSNRLELTFSARTFILTDWDD